MVNEVTTNRFEARECYMESHYMRPNWARPTMETPTQIRDVKESVVALIRHEPEINLISMEF